ncbi:MAG: hypothetical protein MZV70_08600 [Desulfobacterales bacterium]|nr:hypothetical protein [Desulfobacterales bacterium]
MERARRTAAATWQKLDRTSVFLIVVESYGMSAFSDPRHAANGPAGGPGGRGRAAIRRLRDVLGLF